MSHDTNSQETPALAEAELLGYVLVKTIPAVGPGAGHGELRAIHTPLMSINPDLELVQSLLHGPGVTGRVIATVYVDPAVQP